MKMKLPLLQSLLIIISNMGKQKIFPLLLSIVCLQGIATAQTSTIIVTPASTTNIAPGAQFDVTVRINLTGGATYFAAEFNLSFNPALLQVAAITNLSAGSFPLVINMPTPAQSNTDAKVNWSAGNPSLISTSLDILKITFVAAGNASGSTSLTFLNDGITVNTATAGGTAVSQPPVGGSVTFDNACVTPTLTLANSSTCNGAAFDLRIASIPAPTGSGPWDVTITLPDGTSQTYLDKDPAVNGGLITSYTPSTEKIWPSNPTPQFPGLNDGQALETGVKIRSSVAGYIKGLRFYRAVNTGTYTGKFYNSAGVLLASANFPSASVGWQEVLFTNPVQIGVNQTYVASVYSSAGYYSIDYFGLENAVQNGHLTALADGTDGPNGVFSYGGGFPQTSPQYSENYWVDVIFVPSVYTFQLTSIVASNNCTNTGSPIQTLVVNSGACSSLPVTLLNLSATPQGKNVMLKWTTVSEFNNKGFEIQRSVDNSTWVTLGFVNGAINSSSPKNYTYTDNDLFPRRYFYRLKQIDIDGKFEYSGIVFVTIDGKAEFSLGQNFPNPYRGETTIQYTLPETSKVNLALYDMNGRIVKMLINETKDAGTHAENFNSGRLSPGVYYYKIQAGSFSSVRKMIID